MGKSISITRLVQKGYFRGLMDEQIIPPDGLYSQFRSGGWPKVTEHLRQWAWQFHLEGRQQEEGHVLEAMAEAARFQQYRCKIALCTFKKPGHYFVEVPVGRKPGEWIEGRNISIPEICYDCAPAARKKRQKDREKRRMAGKWT